LDGEIGRLEAREATLQDRLVELEKELRETEEELTLTTERLSTFNTKRDEAVRMQTGVQADPTTAGPRAELASLQRTMAVLIGAIGAQAPSVFNQLPPTSRRS